MFDLAQSRIVPFTVSGHTYILTLSPPNKAQWLKYFEAIVNTSERIDGKQSNVFDTSAAKTKLAQALLTDASGYRTLGGKPLQEMENWQKLVPISHCMTAGNILVSVGKSETSDDEPMLLGTEEVRLEALYTANSERTSVVKLTDLIHHFQTPTVEQQRRYTSSINRSFIVGGSRAGKTVWQGGQRVLIELYDELILSVEGYGFNGHWLEEEPVDSIISKMDCFHKVAAAEPLFSSVSPDTQADGE